MKETVFSTAIYNLSTGQCIHLPNVKTSTNLVKSYLGFDPIHKQFKVLLNTATPGVSDEHQVLTLGTPNHSWRNQGSEWEAEQNSLLWQPDQDQEPVQKSGGETYFPASVVSEGIVITLHMIKIRGRKMN
ncbi:unnamed protein product [Brassica oleracea]